MKILLVNPNSTQAMTDQMSRAARHVARLDTEIIASNPTNTPASIQGYLDIANCLPGLIDHVRRQEGYDAIVVGCFDDTGVEALRCITSCPVIGIGEAAYHAASMISPNFGVVTTVSRSVNGLEANLLRYGFDRRCVCVRASDVPVLELERGDKRSLDQIRAQIDAAIHQDGAEAIVLGCAGMTDLMQMLATEFEIPIIDGVTCGVTMAEALVASGLRTSKVVTYL